MSVVRLPALGSMPRVTAMGSARLPTASCSPESPLRSRMSAVAVPVSSPVSAEYTSDSKST